MTLTRMIVVGTVVAVLWETAGCQISGSAQTVRQTAEQASQVAKTKTNETNRATGQANAGDAGAGPSQPAGTSSATAPELKPDPKDGKSSSAVARLLSRRDKRDPFVSVIQTRSMSAPGCAAGKKCLFVDQLVLKGVVKQISGMIAVVENAQRRAYFLREKDPVFNGEVVRITGDSIIFREKTYDKVGHMKMRDVVKRVPGSRPPA